MMRLVGCLLVVAAVGCTAPVGVKSVSLPSDSTPRCQALCSKIGLPLDSVVIMAGRVGCVCRAAQPAPASSAPGASASAGGMAAIMIDEAAHEESAPHHQSPNGNQPTR